VIARELGVCGADTPFEAHLVVVLAAPAGSNTAAKLAAMRVE
jgi:hypothetical protein